MRAMTRDLLRAVAPSVFAGSPWERMSQHYRMVPTIEVVELLESRDFFPVRASQSRTRIEGKEPFTKHMIRFRRAADMDAAGASEVPELVLVNSHDGSAAYKFLAGIFRVVCTNGLVAPCGEMGEVSVRHQGDADFSGRILDATFRVVSETPLAMDRIGSFKQLQLTAPQQVAFAEAALELRDNRHVTAPQLLAPRRHEDRADRDGGRDLWRTLNSVQENMIKGGVRGRDDKGKRTTTRPIKGIDADLKTNKALWLLAEKMAQLLG
jgi:hypothetical protein